MKICTACLIPKPAQRFYKYATGKHMAICKECHKNAVAENRQAKREYYSAYYSRINKLPHRVAQLRNWKRTEAGKESKRISYRFSRIAA